LNDVEALVSVYESDVLDGIPAGETWDLVVGTPPQFDPIDPANPALSIDHPHVSVQRRFYETVKPHLRPGAYVLMLESLPTAPREIYEPIIRAAGGTVIGTRVLDEFIQGESDKYFLLSRW
jgi:hypothetical protein